MAEPLISIIIPVFNTKKYIARCLSSILEQTYTNIEVICVDDGSFDGSSDIVAKYKQKDHRIKLIRIENAGPLKARNIGLLHANGDFIEFVDSDDWIDENFCQCMIKPMLELNADISICGFFEEYEGEKAHRINEKMETGLYSGKKIDYFYQNMLSFHEGFSEFGIISSLWNKLFKRETIIEHFLNVDVNIRNGEDSACLYPCLLKAGAIYVTDCCFYHYFQRPGSNTKSEGNEGEIKALLKLYDILYDSFAKEKEYLGLIKQLHMFISHKMLERCIWIFDTKSERILNPFGGFSSGTKLAIYGAGNWGKHIYRYLKSLDKCCISSWIDQKPQYYQKLGLPVISVKEAVKRNFDYLLICVLNESSAVSIKKALVELGVPQEKIRWINKKLILEHIEQDLMNLRAI